MDFVKLFNVVNEKDPSKPVGFLGSELLVL